MKFFAGVINYLFGKLLLKQHLHIIQSLNYLKRKRDVETKYFDYVRLAALELIANEINTKNIKGNIAELGVYTGKFARFLNRYFNDRILYLFDTFEGFDERDITKEKQNDFSKGDQNFSDTNINMVLKQMPFPDKCIVKKGYFPETAKGMDENFVFVSIDADLYDPIYAGLNYFYDRLVAGGYIFVHDFNNDEYIGAKTAVYNFCKERNISFVPLPDLGGTAIISKAA
jgi:O-methyltransferase